MDEQRTQKLLNALSVLLVAMLVASFTTVIVAALGTR